MKLLRVELHRGGIVALAIPLGLLMAHALPGHSTTQPLTLAALTGRHLQLPWWEAITDKVQSTGTVTYVVPAVVLFATDSSTITATGQTLLRAMKPQLVGATSISIAGCTDSVGGADSRFNVELSRQRAVAARKVLVSSGVNPAIMHILALAGTHPVKGVHELDRATINALNRRIVITVTRGGQS